ncbi:ABC transporter permease [Dellaglioa algida]|uniref:Permease family protein n=1 Tax=Dellaglioa algida DSM 15638 TaxID=1423719 RepID=A0A0R1HGI7_9LACO|nr:ABC transporter permease [Dellaglioa algida]KRK45359.1 permease family protein [Dellaglioa algida DSM 15638]MDK1728706.1 ABC transporter permease [Dellaglioa algida]MDK1733300.1 ABC transporter permease [Dellaglioa algida]MDK1734783.1 ABC transporter permease [Dellaglioa algida]MDK1736265.1 ABC transporter permease [Dellaglioa algida]
MKPLANIVLKSVRRSFWDYLIYVIASSIAVTVYFSFLSMSFNKELTQNSRVELPISVTLQISSFLILIFIACFMMYTNLFVAKRREKEIAVYHLLGVKKSQIAAMLFVENLILGNIALMIGLAVGALFSKLFAMILLRAMVITADTNIIVSWRSLINTVLIFNVIFLVMSVINSSIIYRKQLISLFTHNDGASNEHFGSFKRLLAIVSLFLIGVPLYLAVNFEELGPIFNIWLRRNDYLLVIVMIAVMIILGTLLVFYCLIPILLRLMQKWHHFMYRGGRLLAFSNLKGNLRQNAVMLSLMTLLIMFSLSAFIGMATLYSYAQKTIDQVAPAHFITDNYHLATVKKVLKENQLEIKQQVTGHFKIIPMRTSVQLNQKNSSKPKITPITIMSESDYNRARRIQDGLESIKIKSDESIMILHKLARYQIDGEKQLIHFDQESLNQLKIQKYQSIFPYGETHYVKNLMIVDDKVYNGVKSDTRYNLTAIDIKKYQAFAQSENDFGHKLDDQAKEQTYLQLTGTSLENTHYNFSAQSKSRYHYQNVGVRKQVAKNVTQLTGFFIYVTCFISIILVVATCSIMMLQQMVDLRQNQKTYSLMQSLGVTNKEIRRIVYQQTAGLFLIPVILGSIEALFTFNIYVALFDLPNINVIIFFWGTFYAMYYGLFLITAHVLNRIINNRN